jgi:hypothetical protein
LQLVVLFVEGCLLDVRQDFNGPVRVARGAVDSGLHASGGKRFFGVVVVMQGQTDLFEVVCALGAGRGGADFLHRRHEQSHERADDGDDDEQLDKRKGPPEAAAARRDTAQHGCVLQQGTRR